MRAIGATRIISIFSCTLACIRGFFDQKDEENRNREVESAKSPMKLALPQSNKFFEGKHCPFFPSSTSANQSFVATSR
jgi:hypothetical protein